MPLLSSVALVVSAVPDDDDVVAGWTAFAVFGGLAIAIAVLGFSLVRRLKNVDRAAEQGLYDPSDPKPPRSKPARGLAAVREQRAQAAREAAREESDGPGSAPGEREEP